MSKHDCAEYTYEEIAEAWVEDKARDIDCTVDDICQLHTALLVDNASHKGDCYTDTAWYCKEYGLDDQDKLEDAIEAFCLVIAI